MTKNVSQGFYCLFATLRFHVLVFLALSVLLAAQGKGKDKDKDDKDSKGEAGSKMVKVEGTVHCGKPQPTYSITVPDRSGHALMLAQRKCTWTEPMEILGAKTKDGESVNFAEKMEGTLHVHGFEVDTLDDGEKITMRTMSQVLSEKGPTDMKGRWGFMRGTGKYKGIKGGGTYEGKLDADDGMTLNLEGVYAPDEMAGVKK